ncbi:tetratricopeptide repeat protein [Marinimicrobium alkaliphilum]|uniref:hypothetical protein n=1 Tax=Marinimicrobium alkaliphilum TaxID=2202654 RepID=UPI000DB9E15B|nr:hypothetical protein [Marinimicrobium alkaliphilum]
MATIYRLFCIAVFLMLLADPARATAWTEYRSTNFAILSDQPADVAKSLLREFEQYRAAVLQYMQLEDRPENQRMQVLMYADKDQFQALTDNPMIGGFYANTDAGPRMVVGPMDNFQDSSVVLFHEYVHYLLAEHSQIRYPRWYNEGLSEVLASMVIEEDRVLLGALHPWRRHWLNAPGWHRLDDLMAPDYESERARYWMQFYASSWLTVHYLELAPLFDGPDYSAQTREYLMLYNQGVDSPTAFEQAFDMPLRDMDRQIRRYRANRFTRVLSLPVARYEGTIDKRTLSDNERQFALADLLWRLGQEERAREYLAELDEERADAARGLALRAVLVNHAGNLTDAERDLAKALALDPEHLRVKANAAHFYHDRHEAATEAGFEAPYAKRGLTYADAALAQVPDDTESLYYKALLHKAAGQPQEALRALMAIYQQFPASVTVNLLLANDLMDLERPDLAEQFVSNAERYGHSPEEQESAQEARARLTSAENE